MYIMPPRRSARVRTRPTPTGSEAAAALTGDGASGDSSSVDSSDGDDEEWAASETASVDDEEEEEAGIEEHEVRDLHSADVLKDDDAGISATYTHDGDQRAKPPATPLAADEDDFDWERDVVELEGFGVPGEDGDFGGDDDIIYPEEDDEVWDVADVLDMSHYELKQDHEHRPMFLAEDLRIFLETTSQFYSQAAEFLVAIAEPQRRPLFIHEYILTRDSLYAAASLGMTTEYILAVLQKFSKTRHIPAAVQAMISESTQRYGKVTLTLKNGRYFLETSDLVAVQVLQQDAIVQASRYTVEAKPGVAAMDTTNPSPQGSVGSLIKSENESVDPDAENQHHQQSSSGEEDGDASVLSSSTPVSAPQAGAAKQAGEADKQSLVRIYAVDSSLPVRPDLKDSLDMEEEAEAEVAKVSIPLSTDAHVIATLQRHMKDQLDYPLLAEYAYEQDATVPTMGIELKASTKLRPYQEQSLKKMFNNGRARSGMIVLPCGAGKTLTGVTAVATIKRRAIVLCTSNIAVEQWRREFGKWCNISGDVCVTTFTASSKVIPETDQCIVCTTYSILAASRNSSEETLRYKKWLTSREWGVLIVDEVQTAPADHFRRLLTAIPAHCKLGLTATLVREDQRIQDLRFLLGPKLFEANWIDLQESGYIARVKCLEVWCDMTPQYYEQYCRMIPNSYQFKMKLCAWNPNKLTACEFLIRQHEQRNDKIIVFGDDVDLLRKLGECLGRPEHVLTGATSSAERLTTVDRFNRTKSFKTIFLSRIADNAMDVPDANVLIQISSHGGARRQEAQRLGRILRAKPNRKAKPGEPNAFFYSLVSKDTKEAFYATARQRFLVDQGYSFQVLTHLVGFEQERARKPYALDDVALQDVMLRKIIQHQLTHMLPESQSQVPTVAPAGVVRTTVAKRTHMSKFTGGGGLVYEEVNHRTRGAAEAAAKAPKVARRKASK
eukprot:m.126211 g.126211  ORF g.126211 m.126211 type:complete len:950 (+) comp13823_c1_seq1:101-2950(+)